MQRFFIEALKAKFAADLPQIKTVDLFNEQFNKGDEGAIDSFATPAVFISFPDGADYNNLGAGVQTTTNVTVRFYIMDRLTKSRLSISKTVLEILDLKQFVYTTFDRFQGAGFTAMRRIREEADEDRRNYYVFIQDWFVEIRDVQNYVENGVEVTLTPQIDTELIINPNTVGGVRTAKDVNDG